MGMRKEGKENIVFSYMPQRLLSTVNPNIFYKIYIIQTVSCDIDSRPKKGMMLQEHRRQNVT
jgi:hypothetical protein